jgi:hypothetical protein
MNANLMMKTIEMTTNEAKQAGKIGSDKFKELRAYQEAYPTFTISIKAATKRKVEFKGLTYKYMREYIITHASAETRAKEVAEFDELILISKCQTKAKRYPTIKKWFLAKYPAIAKFGVATEAEVEEKTATVIPMVEAAEANEQNLKKAS